MNENWTLNIDVEELRRALTAVLDHVEDINGPVVSIPHDYFWSVAYPEKYDVLSDPPELTIGQLSESWGNASELRAGTTENVTSFDGEWLGEVLAAIGNHFVS